MLEIRRSGETWHITWPSHPVPAAEYATADAWFRGSNQADWAPITLQRMREIRAHVTQMTLAQALSVRSSTLKDKIIKGYPRINSRRRAIAAEYTHGHNILALSQKYDFPPLILLRIALTNYTQHQIAAVWAGDVPPQDAFARVDARQYAVALAYDAESRFNQDQVAIRAAANEASVVAWFVAKGVGCRTQDDLTAEQVAEKGRAVLTPDILFDDPVYINGTRVAWLDYKDYLGVPIAFLWRSNRDQAAKYAAEWGPGALCYRLSYVDGMAADIASDAILLDGGALHEVDFKE